MEKSAGVTGEKRGEKPVKRPPRARHIGGLIPI